ncbi:MAG: anthranilate synthase component I [Bacillota bacterium]|uniref:anthranilate synthase component I n=1 Tax=Desulforudis sp. DRI-14 TaxID=3459793 RepID=UPI003497FC59
MNDDRCSLGGGKMIYPRYEEFQELARTYNVIPLAEEWLVDTETPISVFQKLSAERRPAFLLESAEGGERMGRYSFIGLEPAWELRIKDGRSVLSGKNGETAVLDGHPLDVLRGLMARYNTAPFPRPLRFHGGAVGYLAYDFARCLERLPSVNPDDLGLPDGFFLFPRTVLVFDHLRHTLTAIHNAPAEGDLAQTYAAGRMDIAAVRELLARPAKVSSPEAWERPAAAPQSGGDRARFASMVRRTREYILAGDILQAVLSRRLAAPLQEAPLQVYRRLRSLNPSPYMFYLDAHDHVVLGASPEMLVRVEDGRVFTRPIAGTRPRGRDAAEDAALAAELLADPKERAEHVMLVDLGRNDLARVCLPGSVRVNQLMEVEYYSHVMHITSEVEGALAPGFDALDALAAAFPAGTVSGAPKIRAMEIIEELEPSRRGVYAGAVGYLSLSGNLDTCIAIRTVVIKDGTAYVQAGAGIVADSDPDREFQEVSHKAAALVQAIGK